MPHLCLAPLAGFRVREPQMLELGMTLPGFQQRAGAVAALPALGLLTLAGLTPPDWVVDYTPVSDVETATADLLRKKPDLVAISALTASINEAYRLADRLRQQGVRVVLGGLHASVCTAEAKQHADAVVEGDGEPVWRQLLSDAAAGRLADVYRAKQSRREPETWAMPRFDLLGTSAPRYTLQTQRGCPLACEFCGASRLLGGFREKPAADIARELDAICELQPRPLLELADDNTFAGNRNFEAFFDAFQHAGARWFTESDWRLGERPELLKRLARAGCVQVLMGIESLVFRYPGLGKKHTELARVMRAVEAIQDAGVAVNGCFIAGADGETPASLQRLVQFIRQSPFAEVQITLQTPFPGTNLYERLKKDGRLLADRDWSHYTLFDVTYQPDLMSVAALESAFRDVLQQVFGAEETARRQAIRRDVWRRWRNLRR